MLQHEDEPLADGTGMPLVMALLALNGHKKQPEDDTPIVEVVIISRNSPETGFRVLKEIRRRHLPITRSAFIAGEDSTRYLQAFYVDLFLTTHEKDAQKVIDSRVCASAVVKAPPTINTHWPQNQVRFAFDADAVLFSEDSELINQTKGLTEFWRVEDEKQDIPLLDGPLTNLVRKLSHIKSRLLEQAERSPIKLAIMTARNSPAEMRVLKTLKYWQIYVDQAFFLGGIEKKRFLKAFNPHIFFDDQDVHLDSAAQEIPCAKVLYPSHSPLKTYIDKQAAGHKNADRNAQLKADHKPIHK